MNKKEMKKKRTISGKKRRKNLNTLTLFFQGIWEEEENNKEQIEKLESTTLSSIIVWGGDLGSNVLPNEPQLS